MDKVNSRGPLGDTPNFLWRDLLPLLPLRPSTIEILPSRPDGQPSPPTLSLALGCHIGKMDGNTTSFTTIVATARDAAGTLPSQLEPVLQALLGASIWNVLFTLLAIAVVYDQCMRCPSPREKAVKGRFANEGLL